MYLDCPHSVPLGYLRIPVSGNAAGNIRPSSGNLPQSWPDFEPAGQDLEG